TCCSSTRPTAISMIPNVNRGVSTVRARNSTFPTRWPLPGGTTTGSGAMTSARPRRHRRADDVRVELLADPLEQRYVRRGLGRQPGVLRRLAGGHEEPLEPARGAHGQEPRRPL